MVAFKYIQIYKYLNREKREIPLAMTTVQLMIVVPPPKVALVVSCTPGEGKSTTSIGLARSYAAMRERSVGLSLLDVAAALDTLPQVASQYLHPTRVQLAKTIAVDMHEKFGLDGRVHFNVGGAQAIEDSLKIVRNARGGNIATHQRFHQINDHGAIGKAQHGPHQGHIVGHGVDGIVVEQRAEDEPHRGHPGR